MARIYSSITVSLRFESERKRFFFEKKKQKNLIPAGFVTFSAMLQYSIRLITRKMDTPVMASLRSP
jgi:hypothetical protein